MTISRVQGKATNSSGSVTSQAATLPSGITSGNLVVAAVASGNNTVTITPPDSSWQQVVINQPNGSSATIETSIWYLVVDGAHAGQTSWTWTFSSSHTVYITISEWNSSTGWSANPVDQSATGDNAATPSQATTIKSGTTPTTTQNTELWIASLAYKGSSQSESGITSGWTKDLEATLSANNTMTMLYNIVSSTGAASCQYVIGTAEYWAGCIVAFKPNVSGGSPALGVAKTTLSFSGSVGGSNPPTQTDKLSETNGVATAWTSSISGSPSWLSISPSSGSLAANGSSTITYTVTTGALGAGVYSATVTFTATTGGATATVTVSFTVTTNRITAAGQFALYANGAGSASFDHFRVTQYPDPSLPLGTITRRVNDTNIAWSAIQPNASCTVNMATSTDGVNWTDVTNTNGGEIPGITAQATAVSDTFGTNTSSNYMSTNKSGGAAASWVWDGTNFKFTGSGGSQAAFLANSPAGITDCVYTFDMDTSDNGGLVFNWVDTQDFYAIDIRDGSSNSGTTNTLYIRKCLSNTLTQEASVGISFTRGTLFRFTVQNLGGAITVSIDGVQVLSWTDASPLGAGQCGLRSNGGTNTYYSLWITQQGQSVTGSPSGNVVNGQFVYTKTTLTSTDPTVTPQLVTHTCSVRGNSIQKGVLVPLLHSTSDPFAAYISDELNNLAKQSATTNGVYFWNIDFSKELWFMPGYYTPAPWVVTQAFVQYAQVNQTQKIRSGDTYRNSQTLLGVTDQDPFGPLMFTSTGQDTSFNMGAPLSSAPTVLVNGQPATVGIKNYDTGKQFYWAYNDASVIIDPNGSPYPKGTILTFSGETLVKTLTTVANATEQATRAAIETGTSGIVEEVEQANDITTDAAQAVAQGYLNWYMRENTEMDFDTLRSGLAIGQSISVTLPQHGLYNKQLVIYDIALNIQFTQANGQPFYVWSVKASDGPYLGPWVDVLSR